MRAPPARNAAACAHHILSTARASSDIRLGSHGGSQTISTLASRTPGTLGDRVLDLARQIRRRRAVWGRQRHFDFHRAVVVNVDVVDQSQLVDIGGNFRIVDGLQRGRRSRRSNAPVSSAGMAEPGSRGRLRRDAVAGDRRDVFRGGDSVVAAAGGFVSSVMRRIPEL